MKLLEGLPEKVHLQDLAPRDIQLVYVSFFPFLPYPFSRIHAQSCMT